MEVRLHGLIGGIRRRGSELFFVFIIFWRKMGGAKHTSSFSWTGVFLMKIFYTHTNYLLVLFRFFLLFSCCVYVRVLGVEWGVMLIALAWVG